VPATDSFADVGPTDTAASDTAFDQVRLDCLIAVGERSGTGTPCSDRRPYPLITSAEVPAFLLCVANTCTDTITAGWCGSFTTVFTDDECIGDFQLDPVAAENRKLETCLSGTLNQARLPPGTYRVTRGCM
jgi:hypothetical protein